MTYEQIKKIRINEIAEETGYLELAKESLGIVSDAVEVDKVLCMLIGSALEDLARVGIDIASHLKDDLLKTTVMLYVKGQYGDADINKRNEYMKRYTQNLRSMQHSQEYLTKERVDNA